MKVINLAAHKPSMGKILPKLRLTWENPNLEKEFRQHMSENHRKHFPAFFGMVLLVQVVFLAIELPRLFLDNPLPMVLVKTLLMLCTGAALTASCFVQRYRVLEILASTVIVLHFYGFQTISLLGKNKLDDAFWYCK